MSELLCVGEHLHLTSGRAQIPMCHSGSFGEVHFGDHFECPVLLPRALNKIRIRNGL